MTLRKINTLASHLNDALDDYCIGCDNCKDMKENGTFHIGNCPDSCKIVAMTAVIIDEVAKIIANKAKEA